MRFEMGGNVLQKSHFLISVLFVVFIASLTFAGEAHYNPNINKETRYWYCSIHDVPTHTFYYSGIFTATGENLQQMQPAYLHFVAEKYPYKIPPGVDAYHSPVSCTSWNTAADANNGKPAVIKEEKGEALESQSPINVVETAWTFGGQKNAEAAESSSASSNSSSPGGQNASAAQSDQLDSFTELTLEQDPRAARLSPLDRQFVVSEARKSKGYCAKDPQLSQSYECTCFTRTVFNYRVAHATPGGIQQTIFPPLASILEKQDLKDALKACNKSNQ